MKKIYSILTLALCMLFAGCSEDDKNNPIEKQLNVISSEVSFSCEGGEGIIKVNSNQAISATSTEEWCKTSIDNKTINLTVEPNLKIISRTAMVTITSGNESTQVPVYQLGDIFDTDLRNADFASEGGKKTYRVKSNWEIKVENLDESWISYTLSEDQLTFTIAPLTENGKYRKNDIKIIAGPNEVPITLTQINPTGDYSCYINAGRTANGTCIIEETETPMLYKITPSRSYYDAPYYAKYRNGQFVIYFGQYLGQFASGDAYTYVYLCAFDAAGTLTWGGNVEYVAPIDGVNPDGKMQLTFKDNGTWPGQKVDGYYYGLFNNLLTQGGSTQGGGVAAIVDLVWVKK